ncbi:glycosyltransferase family 4 protein [Paeniglutamicibacter antarcticus]|uniref:Glycosyltransferase family 4 protein n=1 Tax=Paeniglutamicibacter antarcticus TaxID=494023 RepID=A0ABP9TK08_9MICC
MNHSMLPSAGGKARQLLKNTRIVTKIVIDNLLDDPLYFSLQTARRLDSRWIRRCAMVGVQLLPKRATILTAFCHLLSGNTSKLVSYIYDLDLAQLSDSDLARLGDMSIAIQDPASCGYLLRNKISTNVAYTRTQARYAWYLGDMQRAIDILERAVGSRNKQLRHYQSELEVFEGALPTVSSISGGDTAKPTEKTTLHFLTNSLPHTGSGYAQRSHSIVTSLRDEDWHVEVLTRAGYPISIGKLMAKQIDSVDGIIYRRVLPNEFKSDMKSKIQQQADALADVVVCIRPSVLHTTTDFSNALAVMAVAESFGLPWIYEVRGQLADTWASTRPKNASDSQRYKLFKEREAFVASRASHVITLGGAMKSQLIEHGVPADRISIAPNAIGGEYLDLPMNRKDARQKLGLSTDLEYVGTVSSLVGYEGLDLLIAAAAELIPENPRLRILIVGSGVETNNLVELSKQLGIAEYCIFPGRVPRKDARTYHCALDIFVVPRRDLSVTRAVTPLKPVEALACEIPVIAADLPALRELVVHDVTGLLVKPEDPHLLAGAIRTLLQNPSKRASMGQAGRQIMLAERTWKANAQKLSEIYQKITTKRQ